MNSIIVSFALLALICWIFYKIKNIGRKEFEFENLKNGLKQKEVETKAYETKLRQIDDKITVIKSDVFIPASDASRVLSGIIQQPSKSIKARTPKST